MIATRTALCWRVLFREMSNLEGQERSKSDAAAVRGEPSERVARTGESTGGVEIGGDVEDMSRRRQMRLKAGLGKTLLALPSQPKGALPGSENLYYMGANMAKSPIAFSPVMVGHLLRMFASDPRQHDLALALREVGWVERTLFIINWLLEIIMPQRANDGLNMVEAHHALKNAPRIGR